MAAIIIGSSAVDQRRIRPGIYGVAMGLACALNAVSALFVVAHLVALVVLRASRSSAVRMVRGGALAYGPTMALSCATVPILGLIVVSMVTPLFVGRFLIGLVPFFVLIAADLASRTRRRWVAAGAVTVLLVVGGWSIDEDRPRAWVRSEVASPT